ncbi:MAG: hypothetical protein K0V04_06970 [Deltaproteobacteria bacterium]|nr:hypothetical protein [Deltaproteobacteria bacterium]
MSCGPSSSGSTIRLLNGTKIYPHAVMDNFSRKLLAWQLSEQSPLRHDV